MSASISKLLSAILIIGLTCFLSWHAGVIKDQAQLAWSLVLLFAGMAACAVLMAYIPFM